MIFSLITAIVGFHAYYLSFTEMEYNSKTKDVEVSMKLTAHDLEKEMEDIYTVDINLEKQSDQLDSLLQHYFDTKFSILQKGEKLKMEIDGYEYDLSGDLFVFFHFEKFNPKKEFVLTNKVLFQYFPKQQNIVHFKVGEKKYQKTLIKSSSQFLSNDV